MPNLSDEQLIIDYLKGDKKSLEILIQRYLKPIYGFVYHYIVNVQDAEDITQEVFVRMWRHLKKFDKKKSFKSWIFCIAKNIAIDFLRRKKTIPFSSFENEDGENVIAETIADQSPLPDEIFERASTAQKIRSALAKLGAKPRSVLLLRYHRQLNFREIAESLCEPLNTVKSRHWRALVALRKIIVDI